MTSILCTSAMHLSTLRPQSTKYSDLASWLMPRSISLFRQSLSKALTKDNAEAIVGAALLINYISWFDLSFLQDDASTVDALVQDPLLLASSGITHAWFQTIPSLIEGGSAFLKVMTYHPRLTIENALAQQSDSKGLFLQPLMDIWDDPRCQTSSSLTANTTVHEPASNRAWHLLQGLESKLVPADPRQGQKLVQCDESEKLRQYKEEVTRITSNSTPLDNSLAISAQSTRSSEARSSFAYVVRRISPLIHCQTLSSISNPRMPAELAAIHNDIEQLIYGFPILCCGPFTDLVQRRDTRALVLLLHFYRAARVLLDPGRCWWAGARIGAMEDLILNELELRGLSMYLGNSSHGDIG
ncbi:hypothetical protein LEL_01095 [Akanthomyces lecanii RCEF 1005]|uniref:C6 transcription factor n=1 Tax=Akanthomyces lecanii RCEF 1005 TaxID=1081108 RepID=A0A168KDC0_CORDF|nr:hypothetical protein LEL_01095 [Akanthomyces lecanii RCEF 1005]